MMLTKLSCGTLSRSDAKHFFNNSQYSNRNGVRSTQFYNDLKFVPHLLAANTLVKH